jgi:hypothetical protein
MSDAPVVTPHFAPELNLSVPDVAAVTTDGPLPETSDLVAGWFVIDVESHSRAVELASSASSEPGPAGAAANRVEIALPVHDAMERTRVAARRKGTWKSATRPLPDLQPTTSRR